MSAYAHYFASSPARLRMEAAGLFAQKAAADAEAKRIENHKRNQRLLLERQAIREAELGVLRKEQWKRANSVSRPNTIMTEVIQKHGFSSKRWADEGRKRYETHINCRQEMFYRLKKETTLSLSEIGRRVGVADHSTVISGIRAHQKKLDSSYYGTFQLDVNGVISKVLASRGISEEKWKVLHRDRSLEMLHCRQHVCHDLFLHTGLSMRAIGEMLGGYAESTLRVGIKQHKKRLDAKAPA